MKPHRILKNFAGSQHGNDHNLFEEGTIAHLSDDLAAVVVKEGWAEPHNEDSVESDGEEKSLPAPANKALKAAPQNKKK